MVTVVIPTFNRLSWLRKCLAHLDAQKYHLSFEVIVVDDGSTDGTKQYLISNKGNFTFTLVHLNQENRGPAAARNLGIKAAKGGIVAFLDDDSIAESNWLWEITRSFKDLPDAYAAVSGRTTMYGYSKFGAFLQENFDDSDSWITNNIAYKRTVLLKIGLFDETNFTLAAWEDLDLAYRMQLAGYKRLYNEQAIIAHPREESFQQLVNRYRINGYGYYEFLKKWIRLDPIFTFKAIFWQLTEIHYALPFMKKINFVKYLRGLRLAYQVYGVAEGVILRGNFRIKTRDKGK
jgi:glycosyltransferase involved in cell wall biosynthesis